MFANADLNSDGKVDYGEFVQVVPPTIDTSCHVDTSSHIDTSFWFAPGLACSLTGRCADCMVSFEAYETLSWQRCRELNQLHSDMERTWQLLDRDGSGEIERHEIMCLFKEMGFFLTLKELEQMVRLADDDLNGTISRAEFGYAFHSFYWKRARMLGHSQRILQQLQHKQRYMYVSWHRRENLEAQFAKLEGEGQARPLWLQKAGLRLRRRIRRVKPLRRIMCRIWNTMEGARHQDRQDFVEKDLFLTYYLHLCKAYEGSEFFAPASRALANEEWGKETGRPLDMVNITKQQQARLISGDANWSLKPEGVECIGFSQFFDELWELADSEVGASGVAFVKNDAGDPTGDIDEQVYVTFLQGYLDKIIEAVPNSKRWCGGDDMKGKVTLRWTDASLVHGDCPLCWDAPAVMEEEEIWPDTYYDTLREIAATKIQATQRGKQGRRRARGVAASGAVMRAAVKLQSMQRGIRARERVAELQYRRGIAERHALLGWAAPEAVSSFIILAGVSQMQITDEVLKRMQSYIAAVAAGSPMSSPSGSGSPRGGLLGDPRTVVARAIPVKGRDSENCVLCPLSFVLTVLRM